MALRNQRQQQPPLARAGKSHCLNGMPALTGFKLGVVCITCGLWTKRRNEEESIDWETKGVRKGLEIYSTIWPKERVTVWMRQCTKHKTLSTPPTRSTPASPHPLKHRHSYLPQRENRSLAQHEPCVVGKERDAPPVTDRKSVLLHGAKCLLNHYNDEMESAICLRTSWEEVTSPGPMPPFAKQQKWSTRCSILASR